MGRKPRISAASARSHTRKDGAKRGVATSVYAGPSSSLVLVFLFAYGVATGFSLF